MRAADGVTAAQLAPRVASVLPTGFEAITGASAASEQQDQVNQGLGFVRIFFGIFGFVALFVGAFIIFNMFNIVVSQRTREIGIRLALGARQESLKLMFVKSGLLWAGIGTAAGVLAAAPLSHLMSALLFQVEPIDPLTYAVVVVGLLLAAAVASYLPARRITRIEPVEALRAE